MQYSWGSNVSLPILADVARHVKGHFGVMLNRGAARRLGIADGDLIEVESPTGRTRGYAILREGVRPDVAVILQQFGHWATPFARDLGDAEPEPGRHDGPDADGRDRQRRRPRAGQDPPGARGDRPPRRCWARAGLAWSAGRTISRPTSPSTRCSRGGSDALGHGDRSQTLRRVPDVHHRVQAGARAAPGHGLAIRRRRRGGRVPERAAAVPAHAVHALRGAALRAGLPHGRLAPAR